MAPSRDAAETASLVDLIETQRWQRLQDHFANVLGVAIRTIHPSHELLVSPSWPPHGATDHVVSLLKVGEELDALVPPHDPPQETVSIASPLGVTYAAVPIRANADQALAYFVVGPMVVGPREDKVRFHQRMADRGEDGQAIWSLLVALRPYTFSGIRSLLALLEEVGTSLVQLAYQASQLASLLPASDKVDQAMARYYTDRVLNSLLEVTGMATRAEGGSVMMYDGQAETLKIRAAQGLSDATVIETRQHRGEGLADEALVRRAILLVDDRTTDPILKARMRRHDLISSLIAPLTPDAEREPIGVLNLRTTNRERRFTPEHVEMVRRLLDLAGIALGSLRLAFEKSRPI